jgi:hypothetical protein
MSHQEHYSERFSDTVEFQHKRITNPVDKIMKDILSCMDAFSARYYFKTNNNLQQLHFVLHDTHSKPAVLDELVHRRQHQLHAVLPRVDKPDQPLPRVQLEPH